MKLPQHDETRHWIPISLGGKLIDFILISRTTLSNSLGDVQIDFPPTFTLIGTHKLSFNAIHWICFVLHSRARGLREFTSFPVSTWLSNWWCHFAFNLSLFAFNPRAALSAPKINCWNLLLFEIAENASNRIDCLFNTETSHHMLCRVFTENPHTAAQSLLLRRMPVNRLLQLHSVLNRTSSAQTLQEMLACFAAAWWTTRNANLDDDETTRGVSIRLDRGNFFSSSCWDIDWRMAIKETSTATEGVVSVWQWENSFLPLSFSLTIPACRFSEKWQQNCFRFS